MFFFSWFFRRKKVPPLGARGELRAVDYVKHQLRMKVLATNVRAAGAELDIVALEQNDLVFIEVRTRQTEAFGAPEKTIRRNKRRFLIRAARNYIRKNRLQQFNPRFDTIAIVWPDAGEPEIRHQRNAFPIK